MVLVVLLLATWRLNSSKCRRFYTAPCQVRTLNTSSRHKDVFLAEKLPSQGVFITRGTGNEEMGKQGNEASISAPYMARFNWDSPGPLLIFRLFAGWEIERGPWDKFRDACKSFLQIWVTKLKFWRFLIASILRKFSPEVLTSYWSRYITIIIIGLQVPVKFNFKLWHNHKIKSQDDTNNVMIL